MKKFVGLCSVLAALLMSACGGGGSGSGANGEEITVAYVDNKITTALGGPGGFTANGTELVHDDGYQGNSVDVGRVIISRVNSNATGETLAVAFSHQLSSTPALGTFAAFYIDTDNDPSTGKQVTGNDNMTIGADALFLDLHSFDTSGTSNITYHDYYTWSGTQWVAQGGSYSFAAYYVGRTINKSVFASNSSSVPSLLALTSSMAGVFTVQYIPSGDPNTVVSTIDSTDSFIFTMP